MLKGKTPLLVAIGLALIAGAVAVTAIEAKRKEVTAGWTTIPVIVANDDISAGTELNLDLVAKREIPETFVTTSNVLFKESAINQLMGQKLMVDVKKGEPILWTQFEVAKGFERLSHVIQKKARAVTLTVSEKSSVGGWVRPNDHVDILGTFRDGQTNELITVTLLQDVVVLATGKMTGTSSAAYMTDDARRGFNNVSVMLLPEETEIVTLAQEMGTLTLSLRNPEDLDHNEERGRTTVQTLLTGERVKALQRVRLNTIQVQVISGRARDGDTMVGRGK
jgi:pilus assembly protein CpaB